VQEFPKRLGISPSRKCSSGAYSAEPLTISIDSAVGCISAEVSDDSCNAVLRPVTLKSRPGQGSIVAHCHTCRAASTGSRPIFPASRGFGEDNRRKPNWRETFGPFSKSCEMQEDFPLFGVHSLCLVYFKAMRFHVTVHLPEEGEALSQLARNAIGAELEIAVASAWDLAGH
jgi:hypothetical protein